MKNKDSDRLDKIEHMITKLFEMKSLDSNHGNKPRDTKKNNAKEKREKIDFPQAVRDACKKNEDIFIIQMEKNFAFLLKRKEETVTKILCEGTMNPVEQQKDVVYFDCFALWWMLTKKDNPIPQLVKLSEYGFPIYHVETKSDISMHMSEF